MVLLGAVIAIVLIRLAMPVMSVAIGIYLPLYLSVPIMAGGIISHVLLSSARLRIDGTLDGEPSKEAALQSKRFRTRSSNRCRIYRWRVLDGGATCNIHCCKDGSFLMVWRNWDSIIQPFSSLLCLVRGSVHIVVSKVTSEQRKPQSRLSIHCSRRCETRGVFTLPKLPAFNETEKSE